MLLSAELYSKDVHFLMELIQNSEDNEYSEGVDPSLEFVITSRDITATGAPATLMVFNNEKGFSASNIDSICSVGMSTKKGNRQRGYIGEKGIGFKSVFLITARPYIFSNGYQIRFNEEPCVHCNVGYIVPEWVEQNPTLSDIKQIYGSGTALPTTTLILPLKPDKVEAVKKQLSSIHPEVLLFLSKIKRLSVREDKEDPTQNTVCEIEIASQTDFVTRKNIAAQSYTLHLSAEENHGNESERECSYYMWKQKFPVRQEFRVERRMEVDEWVITLAFPIRERLRRAMNSSPGVYAFLPTAMVTRFPFIIQADFLLSSSRETIQLDNKWNQGILECVPTAFVNAFTSLVKTVEGAPASSLPHMFRFLPVHPSCEELKFVRESIKIKLVEENIVPVEPDIEQRFFCKPREVGRLMPAFLNILSKARDQRVSLIDLSSHGRLVLSHSFDKEDFNDILNFLGVEPVNDEWYVKCIQGTSNLVFGVSEDVYLELLLFVADNWGSKFGHTDIKNIPLIKCEDYGNISLCSISSIQNGKCRISLSSQLSRVSWLIDCNREFMSVTRLLFMPKATQEAIWSCSRKDTLKKWLADQVMVGSVDVNKYAVDLLDNSCNEKLVIAYVHFLYNSFNNGFILSWEVDRLCASMPLVDSDGSIIRSREGVIVPANGSNWAGLTNYCNLWKEEGYVVLAGDYMNPGKFAGKFTPQHKLKDFLVEHAKASDVPNISAPNGVISPLSELTKINAFLLLDWIRELKYKRVRIPPKFLTCIKEGSWLKVTLNGSPAYRPPSQSFLLTPSLGNILQSGSDFVDIPLIDESFYGEKIKEYKEDLKTIGVMFEFGEACEFIGSHLMSLAASSSLTRGNTVSILHFIKFLKENDRSPDIFIASIKRGKWLKTCLGYKSPVESVLSDNEWNDVASEISEIPFIDRKFYGEEILLNFKTELELLGVVVSFSSSYQLIIDNLKSPSCLTWTREVVLLMLNCMHLSSSSEKLVKALKGAKCLKTNIGYKSPGDCLLFHPEWGCILQVFNGLPLIDHDFYGDIIFSYRDELRITGVVVDYEEAAKVFARCFKQHASSGSISKEHVASILSCYRELKITPFKLPSDIKGCIREEKWLRTRLGDYRSPRECILFSLEWESISPIARLPFIEDFDSCHGKNIHEYKAELKSLGVVVEFNEGVKFVASGLSLPQNPGFVSPENALALLECIRVSQEKGYAFPDDSHFMKKVSQEWLKTHAGYLSPNKSLLFDGKFGSYLKRTDGPFIDEEFYGSKINSYKKELSAIGVTVEVEKGCPLIADHLDFHDETSAVVRIYSYLSEFKWKPDTDAARRIWIPKRERVSSDECVIYDEDGLFGLQLTVLKEYFEQNLLVFFSSAFGVKSHPSVHDYLKRWKVWESSESGLSHAQCCKFWVYVSKHWDKKTEKTLSDTLLKVPVNLGSDGILLCNKSDVFIADDLQLKYLFEQSSSESIFVWYPQQSLPYLPRTKLLEIYRKIGVRNISESVQKEELSFANDVELQVTPREKLIGKALFRLILGFLAGPTMEMEAEKRREAVQCLVNVTVVETNEPITVSYNLPLCSGKVLNVRGSRKIRFDRETSKIFIQKMDRCRENKSIIEFATFFSEAISENVLWERTDHIEALSELIKLAFVLDFNEEAVDFLMKSKNLQIFKEDEEFLKSVYPSD